jgi:hypothetical protein
MYVYSEYYVVVITHVEREREMYGLRDNARVDLRVDEHIRLSEILSSDFAVQSWYT